MRSRAPAYAERSSTRTILVCERSTRNACVAARDRPGSSATKSVRMTGLRSSSMPLATSDPTGPMPLFRMIMKPPVTRTSNPIARPPPTRALRHENILWCVAVAGIGRATSWLSIGVACAAAMSAACFPWTMAVAMMIGSPISSRRRANGNTQSGSPMLSFMMSTTWSTTQDPGTARPRRRPRPARNFGSSSPLPRRFLPSVSVRPGPVAGARDLRLPTTRRRPRSIRRPARGHPSRRTAGRAVRASRRATSHRCKPAS